MTALFSTDDLDALRAQLVARAWFLAADLPSGLAYWHSGSGQKVVDGQVWYGVSDPLRGPLVSIQGAEEARFGAAVAVTLVLSGASRAFLSSVHDQARELEGRSADLYWIAFDPETQEQLLPKKRLFPGRMTAPKIKSSGIGVRNVYLTLESRWSSQNFPFGGRWNPADQRRRYPGDKGCDFAGVTIKEQLK